MTEKSEQALTPNRAETDPSSSDPRLRGRTYAIPFDRVWTTIVEVANSSRGWTVLHADDLAGVLRCESQTFFLRRMDDVFVRVSLDEYAQTRVDVVSKSRAEQRDMGGNTRRIGRFFKKLDRRLEATHEQILDPTIPLSWSAEGLRSAEALGSGE